MNYWHIEWDLSIPEQKAINLLYDIIQFPEGRKPSHNKFKAEGKISGGNFEFSIKHSLIWGAGFREEIKGKGSVTSVNSGSHLSTTIEICSPCKYVSLTSKNLRIIIPVFILSWVGMILTNIFREQMDYIIHLLWILMPSFFISCSILVTGFLRYGTVDYKFKDTKKLLEGTFGKYRENER